MTLNKWFKNQRKKLAIKIGNLFFSLGRYFIKKENPEDPAVWLKTNFGIDAKHIVKLMALCEAGNKVRMTDAEYKEFLEEERKESVKIGNLLKSRHVPIYNRDMIEKHNQNIKDFPGDFPLKALMKREESEGQYLLSIMGRPTDILVKKGGTKK